jgi:hypothetical protein
LVIITFSVPVVSLHPVEDNDDLESMVAPRSAGTEDMEPGEYEAYVKTQIAKATGFNK